MKKRCTFPRLAMPYLTSPISNLRDETTRNKGWLLNIIEPLPLKATQRSQIINRNSLSFTYSFSNIREKEQGRKIP